VRLKIPAVIGGVVGVAAAAATAEVVHERRVVNRERALIDPRSAALFGALPVDRESRLQTEDGVSLHVEQVGPVDAPVTVLFVHGFALNSGAFHFQRIALTDAFGDKVRMVFYDQRSHGRSGRSPSEGCTIEQLGRDLFSVIDAVVPAGPIVLVGHSMGGMTIMALGDQHPELFQRDTAPPKRGRIDRISTVALINTSSGNLRTVTLGLPNALARLRGPVLPMVLRRAVKNAELVEKTRRLGKDLAWVATKRLSFSSPDVDPAVIAYCTNMIAATRVEVVADFYETLMDHDGRLGLMNLIGCSVLVIGADHDALTPVSHTEAIAMALPDSELVIAEDAGHQLMLEHPEVVDKPLIELIGAALQGATARRRARHRARS
jgi:pimeloyl-ACP methyl ester carboxylesterase